MIFDSKNDQTREIVIDGSAAITDENMLYEGFGYISANNSSRLLLDYKEENPDAYWEILNYVFGSDGLNISLYKLEMGADVDSSSGTEPAVKRSAAEKADVTRGAAYSIAADALNINPDLKIDMLYWGMPAWVDEPDTDEGKYEARYEWYKETIEAFYDTYGCKISYLTVGQNERNIEPDFIKYVANALENETDERYDYGSIRLVAGEGVGTWGISKSMLEDDELMDFDLKAIMFEENELINKTEYTQAAMLAAECCILKAVELKGIKADITAGLSLGEYAALVASGALDFADAMKLVRKRGIYMENEVPAGKGTMAAVIALDAAVIDDICAKITEESGKVVSAANYNCPGQIVISGSIEGINKACEQMKAAGAKRALPLKVGGAFHSPLMNPAKVELEAAINATEIHTPKCPVYQNVDALPHTNPAEIKANLVAQLTASVRWTQTVKNMVADGADDFTECGPGAVLQGLIKKIDGSVNAHGIA